MKKIITIIILSTLSLNVLSQGVFSITIPQPDFVSNDWDGDGIVNSLDDDDDNDGDKDFEDSTPFSPTGQSATIVDVPYVYNGDTCEDDGQLLQETVNTLNNWSGFNYTTTSWCSLITLELYNAGLTYIPDDLGGVTNLKTVYLQGNSIESVPDSFANLKKLNKIELNNNSLTSFSVNLSAMVDLNILKLHYNQLTSIPSSISGLTNVDYIFLRNNLLTEIPTFLETIGLYQLDVRFNPGVPFSDFDCSGITLCNHAL